MFYKLVGEQPPDGQGGGGEAGESLALRLARWPQSSKPEATTAQRACALGRVGAESGSASGSEGPPSLMLVG